MSVVDERSEIAACFGGVAQCDLGPRTDVMDGCPKSEGMLMMLRSMSPQVLAVDEAGGEGEILAMKYGMNCGVQDPGDGPWCRCWGYHEAAGVAGTGGREGVFPVCGSFRSSGTGNDSGNL